jgi:hypothetical protein
MWHIFRRRCRLSSRVVTEPISTSAPPEGYLVSACTEMSTLHASSLSPMAKGSKARPAPQVLSSATTAPWPRAMAISAGKSGNSIVTEPGASSQTSRVDGVMAAVSDAGSIGS